MSKENKENVVPVYIEAYACDDHGDGPQFALLNVDLAFCEKLMRLRQQCIDSNLSELRVFDAPDNWGPDNFAEELHLTCAELVVTRDSFWFTDSPKHASYNIETRLQDIDGFITQLKNCGNDAKDCDSSTLFMRECVEASGLEGETYMNGGTLFMGDDVQGLIECVMDAEDQVSPESEGAASRPVFIRCEESSLGLLRSFGMEAVDSTFFMYDHARGGVLATGPVSALGKLADFPEDFKMVSATPELGAAAEEVSWAEYGGAAPLSSAATVAKIKTLMEQAKTLWEKLPTGELNSSHKSAAAIDYCLRYGVNACNEMQVILGKQEAPNEITNS